MTLNKVNYQLINNYINSIYKDDRLSYFEYLEKISSFISKNKCEISKDIIENLIKNNSNFSLIINDIVSNTKYLDYVSNPISIKIIDAYFECKQNDLYAEFSYD